jgi:hypothetical protein
LKDLKKNNKEIALEAVKRNGVALIYVSDNLKTDKELLIDIIEQQRIYC